MIAATVEGSRATAVPSASGVVFCQLESEGTVVVKAVARLGQAQRQDASGLATEQVVQDDIDLAVRDEVIAGGNLQGRSSSDLR